MAYLGRIFETEDENVTIPNPLTFSGAVAFTGSTSITATAVAPATDDGQALGSTILRWSDAFLASGGVINWDDGNITITHSAALLTVAGGPLAISDATEASADTTAALYAAGGISAAKKVRVGTDLLMVSGDIDMSVADTGNYGILLKTNIADALSIRDSAADIIVFETTTGAPTVTITPPTTITGELTAGALTASGVFTSSGSLSTVEKTPVNAIAAVGTLTSDATAPADADTVTLDTKVYTFKTTLTPVEGEVLIGGSAAIALDNLLFAVNHAGTAGTNYSCAAEHPTVIGTTNSDTTQLFASRISGVVGNAIAFEETSDHLSVDAAFLGTTTAGVDGTVGVANEISQDATYLYICIATNTIADDNWRRTTLGSAY